MHLTVIHPFGKYKRGDKITSTDEIKSMLEGTGGVPHENIKHVIRTAEPSAPEVSK